MNRRDFLMSSALGATLSPSVSAPRPPAGSDGSFRAGFAEVDITPEIGMEKPGGYSKAYLREFHDACKVRAAVFDDGKGQVALVGVDALVVPRSTVEEARQQIKQECGIAPAAVLIGASHSHSSGPTGMVEPGQYDHATPQVQKLAYEKTSCADPAYLRQVRDGIVSGVRSAFKGRLEVYCGVGIGHEDQVAFNRRFRMNNGLTYTHPGQGNPDILEVAGPIDPEVGVIGVWNERGELLGCVVNYACHATTSPRGISANWIYYLERMIRGGARSDIPVVFLQGASGDVTQVDNLSPYKRKSGGEEAKLVGGRVGAEVLKVLQTVELGRLTPVEGRITSFRSKRRVPSPERVRECYRIVEQDPEAVGRTTWVFAKEIVLLDALLEKQDEVEVEVQAVQIGPAVFVSNPAEFFCQLGLDLKAGSPFPFTFPVELANGSVGYVPTEEALGPGGGGYETRLTSYSNLEVSAGTRMVEAGVRLIQAMTPGKVPTPEKVLPFRSGQGDIGPTEWSYGNVPPELS